MRKLTVRLVGYLMVTMVVRHEDTIKLADKPRRRELVNSGAGEDPPLDSASVEVADN
jgi:hypothetical protein